MEKITVYHNPRCSKSRCALDFLKEKQLDFDVVEYMNTPLNHSDLKQLLQYLDMHPSELARKEEADYKEHIKGRELSEDEWIEALLNYPKLIQRPIVLKGQRAVVARPTERINELLG